MLRSTPADNNNGGLADRAVPISFNASGQPHGENDDFTMQNGNGGVDYENQAERMASQADGTDVEDKPEIDFLSLVRDAETQALLYVQQVNRKAWSQSYRAFHNEHYVGSKYTRPDWRGRSKLFVPKTRGAVRKDAAAVSASLFNNIDAITCLAGNESDPRQKASAAIMQELVNYRTDRTSGKASFPWFLLSVGARQDSVLTGICVSKQYWKQEFRKTGEESVHVPNDEDGTFEEKTRDTYTLEVDRPDMALIPPENLVIDPSACWLNPIQSAAYVIVKWPMQIEEIRAKQHAPVNPWKDIPEAILRNSVESGKYDMAAIRRARELGLDRLDETQTGTHFQVIWVYEVFIRLDGEDWSFYSIGDQQYLTDPAPTRKVYPEQHGERPLSMGYGSLESHRIYPMSPVESWQPLQLETNDLRNLTLDATKQNVMPITKVVRGKQIDLDQVKRRSSGTSIIVTDKDDVTFEPAPPPGQSAIAMSQELTLEMDDLAGQQNYGSVETNNALGKTLGGLKLAAGAANAVQEFDIRVWIETWAAPALSQIVRLEQYYEADPIVLGLVGQKAQLFEKYGINHIDDDLLEQDVTVRVSVGLGAGDPMQRLQKFQSAAAIVGPLVAQTQEFQTGKVEINWKAIVEEVFGAVGYKDGGSRFFKENDAPKQDPMADLKTQELKAKIAKDERTGKAAMFTGIASLAKVALGKRELEADVVDTLLGHQNAARQLGFDHGHKRNDQHLAATDHGHRHGLAITQHGLALAQHKHQVGQDMRQQALDAAQAATDQAGGGAETDGAASTSSATPSSAGSPNPPSASPPPQAQGGAAPGGAPQGGDLMALLQSGKLKFTRGEDGRIAGIAMPQGQGQGQGGASPFPLPPGPAAPAQAEQPAAEGQEVKMMAAILARLEDIEQRLSKPKTIKRDPKTNHIIGVE